MAIGNSREGFSDIVYLKWVKKNPKMYCTLKHVKGENKGNPSMTNFQTV